MEKRILKVLQRRKVATTTGGCFCCSNDGRLERYLCSFQRAEEACKIVKSSLLLLGQRLEGRIEKGEAQRSFLNLKLKMISSRVVKIYIISFKNHM
jgi:hypothetical protein